MWLILGLTLTLLVPPSLRPSLPHPHTSLARAAAFSSQRTRVGSGCNGVVTSPSIPCIILLCRFVASDESFSVLPTEHVFGCGASPLEGAAAPRRTAGEGKGRGGEGEERGVVCGGGGVDRDRNRGILRPSRWQIASGILIAAAIAVELQQSLGL